MAQFMAAAGDEIEGSKGAKAPQKKKTSEASNRCWLGLNQSQQTRVVTTQVILKPDMYVIEWKYYMCASKSGTWSLACGVAVDRQTRYRFRLAPREEVGIINRVPPYVYLRVATATNLQRALTTTRASR